MLGVAVLRDQHATGLTGADQPAELVRLRVCPPVRGHHQGRGGHGQGEEDAQAGVAGVEKERAQAHGDQHVVLAQEVDVQATRDAGGVLVVVLERDGGVPDGGPRVEPRIVQDDVQQTGGIVHVKEGVEHQHTLLAPAESAPGRARAQPEADEQLDKDDRGGDVDAGVAEEELAVVVARGGLGQPTWLRGERCQRGRRPLDRLEEAAAGRVARAAVVEFPEHRGVLALLEGVRVGAVRHRQVRLQSVEEVRVLMLLLRVARLTAAWVRDPPGARGCGAFRPDAARVAQFQPVGLAVPI